MTVDIEGNLSAFLARHSPERRYASFDYCFNYFQHARDNHATAALAHSGHDHCHSAPIGREGPDGE